LINTRNKTSPEGCIQAYKEVGVE